MGLEDARKKIQKLFGAESLMRMGETPYIPAQCISTGIYSLDRAIRANPPGGFPKGRIIELYGQEATGKTSIALSVIAEAQKEDGVCAIIDAEHALDRGHASRLGVNVDALYVNQPSCGEEGLEVADELVRSGDVAVVLVDSVAALVPRCELEGQMGDASMALQARMMNQALRKLTGSVAKTGTCLVFVNQLRDKIGVFYGTPTVTSGGKGLKFYSSLRLEVSRAGSIKNGEQVVGARTLIKVIKNKIAPPANFCEVDLMFNHGFSKEGDLIDLATTAEIVQRSGSWYAYNGERLGQGRENAIAFLKENPTVAREIQGKLK